MPFDADLTARVRQILEEHGPIDERKMFGGIAFMFKGYMCCGVLNDDVVVRLGPERAEEALANAHVRPMDFTGRPLKGYVFVAPAAARTESMLRRWIRSSLEYVETLPPR